MDAREKLAAFTPGNAAAMPDVRLVRLIFTVPREAQTVRGARLGLK
jgi:hypothetical protein